MWHHQLLFISIFHIPVSVVNCFFASLASRLRWVLFTPAMAFSCGRSKTNFHRRWPRACCLLRELFVTVVLLISISFEAFFINIDMKVILSCTRKENLDDLVCSGGEECRQHVKSVTEFSIFLPTDDTLSDGTGFWVSKINDTVWVRHSIPYMQRRPKTNENRNKIKQHRQKIKVTVARQVISFYSKNLFG